MALQRAPHLVISSIVLSLCRTEADVVRLLLTMGRWWYDAVMADHAVWSAMWDRRAPLGTPRRTPTVSYEALRCRVAKQVALRPLPAGILSPIVGCTRSCEDCPMFAEDLVEIERVVPRCEGPRLHCVTCRRNVRTLLADPPVERRLYAWVRRPVLRKRTKPTYGIHVRGYPGIEAAEAFLRALMRIPCPSLTFKPTARVFHNEGSCTHQYEFTALGAGAGEALPSEAGQAYYTVHVGDVPAALSVRKELNNPTPQALMAMLESQFGSESDWGSSATDYDSGADRDD